MGLPTGYRLSDRYTADRGTVFLTGIQALARLPLEQLRADRAAGLQTAAFVSGYPGSPLGGYDQAIRGAAREAPDLPIVCQPALNEEYAATSVMGSQLAAAQPDRRYDGVLGIWYGKAPGVDRASDALRHAVYAGSDPRGGAVALVGDDPAAKSSTLPSSSAGSLFDMHIPVLYPGDPAEALELGRHAIALSRCTGLWTSLKIVADVADGSGTVHLDPERVPPVIPLHEGAPYVHVPDGKLLTPHTIELEREIYEIRYALAVEYASSNRLNRSTVDPSDAWIGIVSSGITYREVREALRRLGLASDAAVAEAGIRLLKMQMPLPFNPATLRHFARGLDELLVIEEKQPNLESLVKDALYNHSEHPMVVGKFDEQDRPLLPGHGALSADDILPALRSRLARRLAERLAPAPELPAPPPALAVRRTPFYCSGCPHNRSTRVPEGSLVAAGIGCHTMVMLMDPKRVGEITALSCMGNEGTQWIGMSGFVERPHLVQNLGDGTYFHSGQLAVQAAVAAGVDITYKLLWNGSVAMTGGQTVQGQGSLASVARVLLAQGVSRVLVTSDDPEREAYRALPAGVEVWSRSRLLEAQETLAQISGVTVLVHDQACAAQARRARKRKLVPTPDLRVVINPRICEGCGDCGRVSNCLSVQPVDTPFGRKTRIDQTTCNLDFSCLEGDCPSFMTVSGPGRFARLWRRLRGARVTEAVPEARPAAPVPPASLPEPVLRVDADDFAVRITGIGGTGIVTVSQVLGTAAAFDGYEVRGLDQIGLSQKAGPVVSDLRLRRGAPAETNRLGSGQADLILACDALVAGSPNGLGVASPERTAVVGSTTATPTGAMIASPGTELPASSRLEARLAARTREGHRHWADASAITTALFGNALTANFFVVGMAVQAGCLPIRAGSVERAIELNGVAVEQNVAAFRWGRCRIADPETLRAALAEQQAPAPADRAAVLPDGLASRVAELAHGDAELRETIALLCRDLVAYQDVRLAEGYLATVAEVAEREAAVVPGSTRLTLSVSRGLHKLLAYKDEYEVARLMLLDEGLADARALAAPGARIAWRLHPPLLRALGLTRKIAVPSWAAPLFRLLAWARWLRGTPLDLFGRTRIRRIERELPGEYRAAIRRVLTDLKPELLDDAVAIAGLPGQVRGFEDIKLASVNQYRARVAEELERFAAGPAAAR
ncbi:MAG: indolepyruvate ferredoxin oxidoreductase family protein [Myxococcota bacterium]|nr:indolepyruvate ferredoxin oxidoreductase family protein [Myxococcota bacterium]